MIWNTQQVRSTLAGISGLSYPTTTPGEDYTTETLAYQVLGNEDRIFVRGFTDIGRPLGAGTNVDVPMVEVTSGYSDGDDGADSPACLRARAEITIALKTMGFQVVRSMDPYF